MALSTTCRFENQEINVNTAIKTRESAVGVHKKKLEFLCIECGEQVRPHRAGGNMSAHFEHLARNPMCSLSHAGK